jgi:hypothetical protein
MKQIFSDTITQVVNDPTQIFCRWFWKEVWNDICAFFRPRQKWLTDKIPNRWRDKDYIIETVLFACLIDYVENEKGIDNFFSDWSDDLSKGFVSQAYVDNVKTNEKQIFTVYKYLKEERPNLEKTIEQFDDNYFELVNQLHEKDTEALVTIIKFRGHLWT